MSWLTRALDALLPSRMTLDELAPRALNVMQTSAPAKPAERASKRLFAGAEYNRLTADWISASTSHDSELRTSLRMLRNRSRQLVRDNEYAKNAVRLIKNNVIGQGIRFQSQVMKRRGKVLDDDINSQIEAAWSAWCRKGNCHTAGTLAMAEMQRVLIGAVAESGEVLVRKIRGQYFGSSTVPFGLEIIEADQLVDEWSGRAPGGNEVRMGVEVDQWQRPVAYWLYPRHPGDYQFVPSEIQTNRLIRVPAAEICHLYISERPGATRAAPWMHAGLKRLNNMGGLEEAEIVAARASAAIMGFIQTPEITDPTLDASGALGADAVVDGQRVYDMEPGLMKELAPGETFQGWNPSRPNANLDPFMRLMLRGFGAAIGVSYESLSRDYSQSNYSSSRLALLDDRDNWKNIQQWFIEHFMADVFDAWLDVAVLAGAVVVPDYDTNRERYRAVRWMPRGWDWIDPLKEVLASRAAVRAGFATTQDILAAKGGDFEDTFNQARREKDLAKSLDLIFDTDVQQVNDKGQAQPVPLPEDPAAMLAAGAAASSDTSTDNSDSSTGADASAAS